MTLVLTTATAGVTEVKKVEKLRINSTHIRYESLGKVVEVPLEHVEDLTIIDKSLDQVAEELVG